MPQLWWNQWAAIYASMSATWIATPWKINWATTYGKLSIILFIKTGNNIFWPFFSYNYWNIYNMTIFILISSVYLVVWRWNWWVTTWSLESVDTTFSSILCHRLVNTTGNQDSRCAWCSDNTNEAMHPFQNANTKPIRQERGTKMSYNRKQELVIKL